MSRDKVWNLTKDDAEFAEWNWWLCRRADLNAKLWPTDRRRHYDDGLTIDQAMQQAYPDWKP